MILTFPYHDPGGEYTASLGRQLGTLSSAFDAICISAIPPTPRNNADFVRSLGDQGCTVYCNEPGTTIGDHARNGLRLALDHAEPGQPIFFGFLDRILFALETGWRDSFLQDLEDHQATRFTVFERSPAAWDTHPSNYREIEHMVSRMCELFCGRSLDLMPCALVLRDSVTRTILDQSTETSFAVWGEWILLALVNGIPVTAEQVDWLTWEHPYWERIESETLKRRREASREEVVKRIHMNVPTMLLLTEGRFKDLCVR